MRDRDHVLHRVEDCGDLLTLGEPLAEMPVFSTTKYPMKMSITVNVLPTTGATTQVN